MSISLVLQVLKTKCCPDDGAKGSSKSESNLITIYLTFVKIFHSGTSCSFLVWVRVRETDDGDSVMTKNTEGNFTIAAAELALKFFFFK